MPPSTRDRQDAATVPLKAAAAETKASSRPAKRNPAKRQSLRSALRHAGQKAFPEIFRQIHSQTVNDLSERSNQAQSDSDAREMTVGYQALSDIGDVFENTLVESLLDRAFPAGDQSAEPQDTEEPEDTLALVDTEFFENSLEAAKLAVHLNERYCTQIVDLESLLQASAAESPSEQSIPLPFTPHQITEALAELADSIELGRASRMVLFNSAKEIFETKLADVYEELFRIFQGRGLVLQGRGTLRAAPATSEAEPETETAESESEEAQQSETPAEREVPSAPSVHSPQRAGIPPAPAKALAELFAGLETSTELSTSEVIERLSQNAVARGFEHGLSEIDRKRTEQAGLLWNAVRQDQNLSWCNDKEMQRLQLPILAAATTDPEFFNQPDHPLRVLLDRLEQFGGFLDPSGDDGMGGKLTRAIEDILLKLKGKTVLDRKRLDRLASTVERLTERRSAKYQYNVERAVANWVARERMRDVQDGVRRELDRRYTGKQVPKAFNTLLSAGWGALLEIGLLQQGQDGEGYRDHLATLDALVQRLDGEPYEIREQSPTSEALLSAIETGLKSVSFDPIKQTKALATLRRSFYRIGTAEAEFARYKPSGVEAAESSTSDSIAGVPDAALERVADIEIGDRLLLTDKKGKQQSLRFAWKGQRGSRFALVDHHGLRAMEIRRGKLAQLLDSGRATLTSAQDRPLSDRVIDQTLKQLDDNRSDQSARDPLTGLYNVGKFQTLLGRAIADARDGDAHLLCWVDLDQFTVVRNSFGLEAANQLIVDVSQSLKSSFAGKGTLSYLGGDHFAALLVKYSLEIGLELADQFRKAVSKTAFSWEGSAISITVSVGVIDLTQVNDTSAAVLQAADATIFAAKKAGGNRSLAYNGEDRIMHQRKTSFVWLQKVNEALDHGRLELRCQRIAPIALDGGLTPHYEVLLGVLDKEGKPLNIGEFITAAEAYNRMPAVDRWITRTAIEWAAEHPEQLSTLGGLAINLSGQTMSDEGIIDYVHGLLRETKVSPQSISFEVTETAAVASLERASDIIRAFKDIGFLFALDDFGSGLSSFSYLKELPVDWLKIDGVFVRNIHRDPEDFAVVKSINEIGHFMGKKTIAEYVENDEILSALAKIGVDYAQGFGVEAPRKLDDLGKDPDELVKH